MDASNDPRARKIVLMWAAQMAKTKLMENIIAYRIDRRPGPMIFMQPSKEDAEDFSKERLAPMLADCEALRGKIAEAKSRVSSTTILRKDFPGGWLGLVGANAPRGFRRRSVAAVFADEIDEYSRSIAAAKAPAQGDPLRLLEIRMSNFPEALLVVGSTPTMKDESAIEREYNDSTQEEWCVRCSDCGEWQPYEWEQLIFPGREGTDGTDGTDEGERPERPMMSCRNCGAAHEEYEWKQRAHQWVALRPWDGTGTLARGFRVNAMASPWKSWDDLIVEFRQAVRDGPETLQVFVNTRLCRLWEAGEKVDEKLVDQRRHHYDCDVPAGVVWLTAGVDVHKDRLEYEIVGWGVGEESWGIEYGVIPGEPVRSQVWQALDERIGVRGRSFAREDGVILPLSCVGIDCGYAMDEVHRYCKARNWRYVFAVRGEGGPGRPIVDKVRRRGRNVDVYVFPVGTDAAKDLIFGSLAIGMVGPGYMHFPMEPANSSGVARGYDERYFRSLLSERRERKRSGGRVWHVWVKPSKSMPNEALDCRVYALAALKITAPDPGFLDRMAGHLVARGGGEQRAEGREPRKGWKVLSRRGA
jgi:phage terminase large subunit GpA-like protein